jgi:DNA-binding NarL/FixJ family response regulator
LKVLIADDHAVVRQGLRQILATDPEMVVAGEAKDGAEAMSMARNVEWDVAVFDFSMPGLNGLDLLGEMKREFPKRPVLILSMHPEDLFAARVLKAGGAGYITKESATQELTAAVKKVAGGGKYISPTLAEALAVDLAPDSLRPLHESLSDREYRVMWLLASGKQVHQISKEMGISPSTVSTYRTRILKKLKLNTNAELVRYAISHKLVA